MSVCRVLVIDNYDSFSYNLVQLLGELGVGVIVRRNDAITVDEVFLLDLAAVVISPGPKRPEHAGVSMDLVRRVGGHIPILGVCLGHQCIGSALGARIVKDRRIHHGKTSFIHHDGTGIYQGIKSPFTGARYHSLVIEPASFPGCLSVVAWTEDGVVMGIRHKEQAIEGVQFHPESFMTPCGQDIMRNFLEQHSRSRLG